jgi:cytochrome c-type biogenesis protein
VTAAVIADVGSSFRDIADHGSLVLAIPVALLAGLVSFLSPCVLPLVPGYLSYVTGLSGSQLDDDAPPHRGRVLAGSLLFVMGFALVFVAYGALFGGLGAALATNQDVIIRVLGVFTIAMGLIFMGALGWMPGVNRDVRIHRLPAAGLAGAPVLGVIFGLGWTPCLGPTAAAVATLMLDTASAGRGAILGLAYCLGIGIPFVAAGMAFNRAASALAVFKRHYVIVTRTGGAFLVVLGLLQVSGAWNAFVLWMQVRMNGLATPI